MPSERPSTILMTADTVGGVWTYTLELCAGLSERGVDVVLCTMGAPLQPDQREAASRIRRLRIEESAYRLEWMEDPWEDVGRAGEWLLSVAREVRPDVVHLNNYCHGALPFDAPVLMVGHSCVRSWFEAVKGCAPPPSFDRYGEEVRRGLHAAHHVVTPSEAMRHALERHYGPLRASSVILNARALQPFAPAKKAPYILAAGRIWDEAKNIDALCRVAPALRWEVRIAGDMEPPGRAQRSAEPRPSTTHLRQPWRGSPPRQRLNVAALGRLSQPALAEQMAHAGIYAFPARYEPFGLSVLEAAQSGCALVLGDIPSLRELWDGCAVFVPPDDLDALREALRGLIDDPARREALGRKALARARRYPADAMIDAYLAQYARLREAAKRMRPVDAVRSGQRCPEAR